MGKKKKNELLAGDIKIKGTLDQATQLKKKK